MSTIATWPAGTSSDWINAVEAAIKTTGGYVDWEVVARNWDIDPTTDLLWLPQGLPACQFKDKKVLGIVCKINRLLDVNGDPMGVTDWWFLPNVWLKRQAPASLLNKCEDERLLSVAKATID